MPPAPPTAAGRAYLTPGVYLRPPPPAAPAARLVRTDVAGFVGYAERGPLPDPDRADTDPENDPVNLALRVTDWKQFTAAFGGFLPNGYLAYAVRGFFDNGGAACYVVRVAATHHPYLGARPTTATVSLPVAAGRADVVWETVQAGETALPMHPFLAAVEVGNTLLVSAGAVRQAVVVTANDGRRIDFTPVLRFALPAGVGRVQVYLPGLTIRARSAGNWGNRLRVTLTRLADPSDGTDFSLRVTLTPTAPRQRAEEEFYPRVSLTRQLDPFGTKKQGGVEEVISLFRPQSTPQVSPDLARANQYFVEDRVNPKSNLIEVSVTAAAAGEPGFWQTERAVATRELDGGQDGLSGVTTDDFTGTSDSPQRGLGVLDRIDEVSIVCVPDAVYTPPPVRPLVPGPPADPCAPAARRGCSTELLAPGATAGPPGFDAAGIAAVQMAAVEQCERKRDRVAVLDTPGDPQSALKYGGPAEPTHGQKRAVDWRQQFATRFAALYYPWLRVPDPLGRDGATRVVPPCGHVAGVYAQTDLKYGVQEPPANVRLAFAADVTETVDALHQEALNYWGVNAIRPFGPRGLRVWGARSLAPVGDGLWRFIHVRRLLSMIEQTAEYGSRWAAFEPNTDDLRRALAHSMETLLTTLWRKGGLAGATAGDGFFVTCDETNNPSSVVAAGQVVCRVGVAVVAPTEFLVFTVRQRADGAEVVEE